MITEKLQAAGYQVDSDVKGRYMAGIIRRAGGLYGLQFLNEPYMVELFRNAQLRKGEAFTYRQLQQMASPGDQQQAFQAHIRNLIEKGLLLRGYRVPCPSCGLDSFHALAEMTGEALSCPGCGEPNTLSLEQALAYQANPLLMRALNNGALAAFMALLALASDCETYAWQAGLQLTKDGQTHEIDLIVDCDGQLTIAECKDHFEDDEAGVATVTAQLTRAMDVARAISAQFIFATLRPGELPGPIAEMLEQFDSQREA